MSLADQLKNLGFSETEQALDQTDEAPVIDKSIALRIQRQTKGRKGKGVTVIIDLPEQPEWLQQHAKALRKKCGVGGAIKDGTIELQGDQRETAKHYFEDLGFTVKLAGG